MKAVEKIKSIKFSKRMKITVSIVSILLVSVLAFGFFQPADAQQSRGAAFTNLQTETARVGSLESTIGATGKVLAVQSTVFS